MNQYRSGRGADRQAWLSFWSGAPVIVNRKSRKQPIVLPRPFVGVAGCLPPEVLGDLSDERGREDGFLHRILFAFPEPLAVRWSDAATTEDAMQGYTAVVQRLLDLRGQGADEADPRVVTMTPGGRAAYVEVVTDLYAQLNSPDCPPHMRGPLAKLEGYGARLALILQLARRAAGQTAHENVEELSVLGAAALVHYFACHARRLYAHLHRTPADRRVELAVAWIRAHGRTATAREILTYKVAGVASASAAKDLLRQVADHGYGTLKEGGRHRVSITLQ